MRKLEDVLAAYSAIADLPDVERRAAMAALGKSDIFYLLTVLCRRADAVKQWILDRCDEVACAKWGHVDLWARGHYKSTIITFAGVIQEVLNNPDVTIGIFSHTRPNSKKFLVQIKRELESNELLKELYPDILWSRPEREAPRWSDDGGLVVRRSRNPKESTIEAWGLVDGQPIGSHFDRLIFDDIVTQDTAWSPGYREKVIEALQVAFALGSTGYRRAFVGTRYHSVDAYAHLIDKGIAIPRVYPCVSPAGEPVLMTKREIDDQRLVMGSVVFAAQMLLDPRAETSARFTHEHLRYYDGEIGGQTNTYILVDAASSKKAAADYTAVWVVSLAEDQNYYVRWFTRDRLSLVQRINLVMRLHREWAPKAVGYERYGMMGDVEMLRVEQERQGYRFDVTELGGQTPKPQRIERLLPLAEDGRLYFPRSLYVPLEYEGGERYDVMGRWIAEEWLQWSPVAYSAHDDGLDALSRICDETLGATFPRARPKPAQHYQHEPAHWMAV